VIPTTPNDSSPPEARGGERSSHTSTARLSYRLKTFTHEPAFDSPWFDALRHAARLPDLLLLSSGIWDMQYPPDDAPSKGADAFVNALRAFLAELESALQPAHPRGRHRMRTRRLPRIFWLTVTAVSDAKLPQWKRPRMSTERARQYNALALPLLRRAGIVPVDTFTSGAAHPELSADGVHFPGAVSRHHSQLFWDAACRDVVR
jgi:hypothetical protein